MKVDKRVGTGIVDDQTIRNTQEFVDKYSHFADFYAEDCPENWLLCAYKDTAYMLIAEQIGEGNSARILEELNQIRFFYHVYKCGMDYINNVVTCGHQGWADIRFRQIARLIDKEARFLFAEKPDIRVELNMDVGQMKQDEREGLNIIQQLVDNVLTENNFEENLLKALKDCLIGKRVAAVINFDIMHGIFLTFFRSTDFLYEYSSYDSNKLIMFTTFTIICDSMVSENKFTLKKRYDLVEETNEDGNIVEVCYCTEEVYNGLGERIDDISGIRQLEGVELLNMEKLEIDFIPARVIINGGLLKDTCGVSDVQELIEYEKWYSMLIGNDIDSLRKQMYPTIYTVDMDHNTTAQVDGSIGGYIDLESDRKDPQYTKANIGMLESSMKYTDSLSDLLDKIRAMMYEQLDIPDISLESIQGAITSGKGLKAIYWSLIVRCAEKMKTWRPAIQDIVKMIIKGSYAYQEAAEIYTSGTSMPLEREYQVAVEQNYPLPEDELEEKASDMAAVNASLMSRSSYMQKWNDMTAKQAADEMLQILYEMVLLDENEDFDLSQYTEDEIKGNELLTRISEMMKEAEENPEINTEETINI